LTSVSLSEMKWSNYFLQKGNDFQIFWKDYLSLQDRNVLFLAGLGFDPRTSFAYKTFLNQGGIGQRDCFLVKFEEGPESPSQEYAELVQDNHRAIKALVPSGSKLSEKSIQMQGADGRRIGSKLAASLISLKDIMGYDDIVIDVSAMPRGIFFPLIAQILSIVDSKSSMQKTPNLHIVVSENAELDGKIRDEGIEEDASYMHRFTGPLNSESTVDLPKVWIPILGERQAEQLDKIYELVKPDEVSPIVPFPASNPRRADDLLLEYRELLFDTIRVESGNVVYVSEQNPFEAYREIFKTVYQYNHALDTLGGCQVVISALSSKLLSLGALLAAYDLKIKGFGVGIAQVETSGYRIEGVADKDEELKRTQLTSLWLRGDCYE
jgi:hypothetical protein